MHVHMHVHMHVRWYHVCMASKAEITIRVRAARGHTTIEYTSKGRYVSFITSGYQRQLLQQPIQATSSLSVFWLGILQAVIADITANP